MHSSYVQSKQYFKSACLGPSKNTVRWNAIVTEVLSQVLVQDGKDINLDEQVKEVKSVKIKNVETLEESEGKLGIVQHRVEAY